MTHLGESPRDPHVVHEPAARRRAVKVPQRAAAAAASVLVAVAASVVFAAAAVFFAVAAAVFVAAASFAAAAAARGVAGADREEVARHEVARGVGWGVMVSQSRCVMVSHGVSSTSTRGSPCCRG